MWYFLFSFEYQKKRDGKIRISMKPEGEINKLLNNKKRLMYD